MLQCDLRSFFWIIIKSWQNLSKIMLYQIDLFDTIVINVLLRNPMQIVRTSISVDELKKMSENMYGGLVKAVEKKALWL